MNRTVTLALVATALTAAACGQPGPRGETPVTAADHEATAVPGALHGTVRTRDGQPIPGVMVTATSTDDPQRPVPELAVMTDDQGRYEWPLVPGRYRITVTLSAGEASSEITVGEHHDLDLTLAP